MNNRKKLYRSGGNMMIAGVCGGIGEYFNVDAVLIRIVFLLLSLMGGSGVFFYIFCWVIIPKQGSENRNQEMVRNFADEIKERATEFAGGSKNRANNMTRRNILGVIIILFGFVLLFNKISPFPFLRWDLFWLIVIILVGFYMVFKNKQ
jgi:phage shock protein C